MTLETGKAELEGQSADTQRMPAHVRRLVFAGLALIGGFATYLLAVRGTAIVYDLGKLGAMLLCL